MATFNDGNYQGQYDWQGGIPLSVGETLRVTLEGKSLTYKLVNKETSLVVQGDEQLVTTSYFFDIAV